MAKLKVELVTPERRVLSATADEAIVPGASGLFGVRPAHTPFLSLMEPGVLTLREGTSAQHFFIASGFVEVNDDEVLILADRAEPVTSSDLEAARERAAQERLTANRTEDARFELETATVRSETARMAAAGRH
jgi:F-type H+-transporting ATPase subunit epsilon